MDELGIKLHIELNPEWPPQLGKYVISRSPNIKETFIGKVIKHIWNKTGTVIMLLNHLDYEERVLDSQKVIQGRPNGKGLFLLIPTYSWTYIDEEQVRLLGGKINLINEELHADPILKKFVDIPTNIDFEKDYLSNDLLTDPRKFDLDNIRTIEIELNDDEILEAPTTEKMKEMIDYLSEFTLPFENIVTNLNIAINNPITSRDDEFNEGNKIIDWFKKNMITKEPLFESLKVNIYNGYLYFGRKGIRTVDIIEPHRVLKLERLDWQYGKPIDYQTLKQHLFLNRIQLTLNDDVNIQKEAELIMSQEYLISLQPQPKYQLWMLIRILIAWFADVDLQNNIRMIKILINQFRVNPESEFNHKNGILPSIVIYPRYGVKPSRIVLSKINYYMSLYTNLGVLKGTPTYFIKINDILSYTNGSIDLKLYFREMMKDYSYLRGNHSFTDSFTTFKSAEKLNI
jgi:hypothetical protein